MAQINENINRFKIILVGDGEVGKTTFVNHHLKGEFITKYVPTLGVDVHPIPFNTNYGIIIFDVWDTAGQEKFGFLHEGYYIGARGAICMFNTTSTRTLRNVPSWIEKIKKINNIPVSIYGSKSELPSQLPTCNFPCISTRNKVNMDLPFLNLAREITKHEDLIFID